MRIKLSPSSLRACARFFAALVLVGAAASCGIKPPEISAVEWRLESRPSDAGPVYESLSVFGVVKDEEGLDNIVELWIVNDESALCWKLTSADWIKVVEGGDTWLGGSALTPADFSALPRSSYRLVAIDAAGDRAEREFRVAGEFPQRVAPSVSFSTGELRIKSEWPETLALAFDGAGALIAFPGVYPGTISLEDAYGQDIAQRTAELGIYGYDPTLRMGSFSARVKVR